MQTFYAIVNRSGGYTFTETPLTDGAPSTYMVRGDEAELYVYWQGRTAAEMTNADELVIPVHEAIMDAATGSKGKVN